jgi:hypothetical protein
LARQSAHRANKLSDLAAPGNRLGAIAPVLEVVLVTLRRARRSSAVHPASTVRHCCLLARLPGRPAVGTASPADVHRQFASHGVDPPAWCDPCPPPARRGPLPPDRRNERGHAEPSSSADSAKGQRLPFRLRWQHVLCSQGSCRLIEPSLDAECRALLSHYCSGRFKARDLCLIAPFPRYTTPFGAGLLMNSATKARPISSCSIVPKDPGIRRPNQAA